MRMRDMVWVLFGKDSTGVKERIYCGYCYYFEHWDSATCTDITECGHPCNVVKHWERSAVEVREIKRTYKQKISEINSLNNCLKYAKKDISSYDI